jgi:hypothetical protein
VEHELVNAWKRMITRGNQSFNAGKLYSAENYYEIACNLACHMCPKGIKSSNDIASLLVSYQNLAELSFKKSQNSLALTQYQKLHEKLIESSQGQQSSESLLMIQQAIRNMGTELLYIIKKKGINSLNSKQVIARIMATEKLTLH